MIANAAGVAPLLDKGGSLTTERPFTPSLFHDYLVERRRVEFEKLASGSPYVVGFQDFTDAEVISFERIYKKRKQFLKTINKKIRQIISKYDYAYFITFTFEPDFLENTTKEYRRIYIQRILKAHFPFYVANIDFGDLKGREHYHAIIGTLEPIEGPVKRVETQDPNTGETKFIYCIMNEELCSLRSGFVNIQRVMDPSSDRYRLSKYIAKLKLHAVKDSTKITKPIYSRRVNNGI